MRLARFSKLEAKGESNVFVKVHCPVGGFVEHGSIIDRPGLEPG